MNPITTIFIYFLFFLSGFVALVYEVLWMKELGLLFGNTAHATATVLTAFFCGLGAGSYYWGKRSANINNPLRYYAILEFGIAISAIGYFIILSAYRSIYPFLFDFFHTQTVYFLLAKFSLSLLLLFPPALFMGGTLPVMSQFLVHNKNTMGLHVSGLYATNTLGAACGTLAAGFLLPRFLGFNISFAVAMSCNIVIALATWVSASKQPKVETISQSTDTQVEKPFSSYGMLLALAFVSGIVTLALQVLWVRMFSQVLHNSVYTFSIILTVFLLMLALAAAFSNALMRIKLNPVSSICLLLTLGAILTVVSIYSFSEITAGLDYIKAEQGWWQYILKVLGIAFIVMGPALLCLGAILPLTFKLAEQRSEGVGQIVGKLTAVNTLGAVIGSLLAGFIMLESVGLWQAIRLIACIYLLSALVLISSKHLTQKWFALPVCLLLFTVLFLDLSSLPMVKLEQQKHKEKLLELWEDSAGTVAVVQSKKLGGLSIKVNNHYTLGSTGAILLEELQTDIPMLLHPKPDNVYMLGLGTGITAGAAFKYPVKKLTVTELVPNVIAASKKHFSPFLHGLFTDPRATVVAEDGRNYLMGTQEKFDVIIADLLVLWKSGTGYLYTREHFQAVADRLQDEGIFMQWLPSHQMTEKQFNIISKTLLSVFPQVTLWRCDFIQGVSLVGLMAQKTIAPYPEHQLLQDIPVYGLKYHSLPLLSLYVGNLSGQSQLFQSAPLNTDDLPVIVYDSPITQRQYLARQLSYFSGNPLIKLTSTLQKNTPPHSDPFLDHVRDSNKQLVAFGEQLHKAETFKGQGKRDAALQHYQNAKNYYQSWKQENQ